MPEESKITDIHNVYKLSEIVEKLAMQLVIQEKGLVLEEQNESKCVLQD